MTGVEKITKERKRQIEEEHWSPEHDDKHTDGSLALAAICYATPVLLFTKTESAARVSFGDPWPNSWLERYDKRGRYGDCKKGEVNWGANFPPDPATYTKKERLDLLVKAGALIAAEIDRLQRL